MTQPQEEISVSFEELPNIGVLVAQVPQSILSKLTDEVNAIIENNFKTAKPYNHDLLGHMRHEYDLSSCIPELEPFVLTLSEMYNDRYQWFNERDENYNLTVLKKLRLTHLWVNIQQKHEFNPPHEHTGIMSFVFWLKIPYDLQKEEAVFPPTSGISRTSKFSFHYSNILGQHRHYMVNVDKNHEGWLTMFPSKLNHSVNPFYTSDEYRISIAGNMGIR
jgi:hypothetical protein